MTLSEELLLEIEKTGLNRSAFLQAAARRYLAELARRRHDNEDVEATDADADALNREVTDVLDYQTFS